MKNSDEMCQSLCMPFVCYGFDSRYSHLPEKLNIHYYGELILVREGRLRVIRNQEEQIVSAGEAVLFCPAAPHRIILEGSEPVRMDVIRADPDRMPELPGSNYRRCPDWETIRANIAALQGDLY